MSTLRRAQQIGIEEGLHHVYVGNVRGESNTVCHECGERLIRRSGYRLVRNSVAEDGVCPNCGTPVAGVGMASVES